MTREEIESEGWKEVPDTGKYHIPETLKFRKENSSTGLMIKVHSNHLVMMRSEPGAGMEYKTVILYNGPCPSIEDFKYITGLFKNY